MTPYIYDFLLLIMLYVLFRAGRSMAETGSVKSPAGFVAILVYTLNEGLRFGRGIDYNLYGMSYENLEATGESDWDISFQYIARFLISMDIPWQGYVILMSLIFVVAIIMLLRFNYKEVLPYALPLFALFSRGAVENMVRWYLGFSFILIGLAYLLQEDKKFNLKFWGLSIFACTFHLALLPLPFAFYLLTLRKHPLLSPMWVLILYFGIAFFFQTDFMMQFINVANFLSSSLGDSSERLSHYGDRAEYWLTGGFAGVQTSVFPNMHELVFLCCLVWVGYQSIRGKGEKYIYAYNMFVVGILAYPLARQIELIGRFDEPFMFFRAIVLACVIKDIFVEKKVVVNQIVWIVSLLIVLNMGRKILVGPITGNPDKYLYVWDSEGKTYQSMYDMWIFDMYNDDAKKKRQD